jgi:hypothetical protein
MSSSSKTRRATLKIAKVDPTASTAEVRTYNVTGKFPGSTRVEAKHDPSDARALAALTVVVTAKPAAAQSLPRGPLGFEDFRDGFLEGLGLSVERNAATMGNKIRSDPVAYQLGCWVGY